MKNLITTRLNVNLNNKSQSYLGKWCLSHCSLEIIEENISSILDYHWNSKSKFIEDSKYIFKIYESYITKLSKALNNFHKKNVNIAYRSNGPVIELLSLKFFVNKVNAKAILWFFYEGNDFNDLIEELSVQKIRNLYTNYDEKMIFTNEVNKNLINLYEDSFNKYISNNINNGEFNSLKKFLSLTMIRNFLKYNLAVGF